MVFPLTGVTTLLIFMVFSATTSLMLLVGVALILPRLTKLDMKNYNRDEQKKLSDAILLSSSPEERDSLIAIYRHLYGETAADRLKKK